MDGLGTYKRQRFESFAPDRCATGPGVGYCASLGWKCYVVKGRVSAIGKWHATQRNDENVGHWKPRVNDKLAGPTAGKSSTKRDSPEVVK
jgi:hypothetical protein